MRFILSWLLFLVLAVRTSATPFMLLNATSGGDTNVYPLDAWFGPAPQFAVATRKLRSGYTGFAFQLRRTNDQALTNVGFVGAALDTALITNFAPNHAKIFIAKWYDQTTNGVDFQQVVTNTQMWLRRTPGTLEWSVVKEDANGGTVNYMTNATANLFYNTRNHSSYQVARGWNVSTGTLGPFAGGGGVTTLAYGTDVTAAAGMSFQGGGGVPTIRWAWTHLFNTVSYYNTNVFHVYDTDFQILSVNTHTNGIRWKRGLDWTKTNTAPASATNTSRFGIGVGLASQGTVSSGELRAVVVGNYNDPATESNNLALLNSAFNVPQPTKVLWWFGDSISEGWIAGPLYSVDRDYSGAYYLRTNFVGSNWITRCGAKVGWKSIELFNLYTNWLAPYLLSGESNFTKRAGIVHIGYNDVFNFTNVNTIHTNIQLMCETMRSNGFDKVFVTTLITNMPSNTASNTTQFALLSGLIRSNWSTYADGLVDLATNNWSGQYVFDNTHLNTNGMMTQASIVYRNIRDLLP